MLSNINNDKQPIASKRSAVKSKQKINGGCTCRPVTHNLLPTNANAVRRIHPDSALTAANSEKNRKHSHANADTVVPKAISVPTAAKPSELRPRHL